MSATHEVSSPGEGRTPSREELAAAVVMGVHRLVKQSTLYAADNEAQVQALELTRRAVAQYGRRLGANPQIFFTEKSVFVGGRLLRAGRTVYAAALELGKVLRQFDVDEIAIGYDVPVDDLQQFQAAIRAALRREGPSPVERRYARIRLRRGQPPGHRGPRTEELPPEALVVRVYATATVVMRRFLEGLQKGKHRPPVALRRVAQQLAELGAVEAPGLLGKIAVHNVEQDHAGRAVNAALVAMGMSRQLVRDKRTLARIATAALMHDVGVPRVAGTGPLGEVRVGMMLPTLVDDQIAELPAAAAAMATALGGFKPAAQMHTVMVHEALSVTHREHLTPLYGGLRYPTLSARILATARRFTELLADPNAERTADEAIQEMRHEARDEADRTTLRLLLGALGIFPKGALVELSNGLICEVEKVPTDPLRFGLPLLRPVMDQKGGRVPTAPIDLAEHRKRGDGLSIRRVMELGDVGSAVSAPPVSDPVDEDESWDDAHEPHPSGEDSDDPAVRALFDSIVTADDLGDSGYRLPDSESTQLSDSQDEIDVEFDEADLASDPARDDDGGDDDDRKRTLPRMPRVEVAESDGFYRRVTVARQRRISDPSQKKTPSDTNLPAIRARYDSSPELVLNEPRDIRQTTPTDPSPVALVELPSGAAQPTARGVLSKRPLVHLLIYALDQGLTGTTQLIAPDGSHHFIYFADGAPGKVRTAGGEWPLDRVLTDLRMLDELTLQQSLLAISKSGELHGRYLVARGILDLSSVMSALRAQLARKITVLFDLPPETHYLYFAGHNLLDGYGGPELTPVEPLALIARGVRRLPEGLIRDTVARVGDAPLRVARDGDIGRLQLSDDERTVVDLLVTRPFVLRELLARDDVREALVLRTLYLLIVTRYLKLGAAGRPVLGANKSRHELPPMSVKTPVPTSSQPARASVTPAYRRIDSIPSSQSVPPRDSIPDVPSSVPPAVKSSPTPRVQPRVSIRRTPISPRDSTAPTSDEPPARERRGPSDQDVESRFRNIDDLTYYEILGVDSKAPDDHIEAAYFQLAKLWHPDRVHEDAALRTKVAKIFARMNEAYQTLTDPDRRRDYDGVVSAGGGTARDRELVERAVDSALLFQKAEVFFRRGNLEHAEKLLDQAVQTDPQQPEYRALLAWIQAKRLGAPPKASDAEPSFHYREQLRILNEVLDKEPHFERALFYRAELYKLSGDMERAIRDYRKVVKLNKRNIDAAREVRLYDMRAQKSGGGGLFGGLFGKSQKPSKPPRTPTSGRPRK